MEELSQQQIKKILQERLDGIGKNTGMPLEVAFEKLREGIKKVKTDNTKIEIKKAD